MGTRIRNPEDGHRSRIATYDRLDLHAAHRPPGPYPLQVSVETLPPSWNIWTMSPVVNACTTAPVAGSTSAAASRTSMPVILLISCRSESDELANSCR